MLSLVKTLVNTEKYVVPLTWIRVITNWVSSKNSPLREYLWNYRDTFWFNIVVRLRTASYIHMNYVYWNRKESKGHLFCDFQVYFSVWRHNTFSKAHKRHRDYYCSCNVARQSEFGLRKLQNSVLFERSDTTTILLERSYCRFGIVFFSVFIWVKQILSVEICC